MVDDRRVRRPQHIVAAVDLQLSPADVAALEEPDRPHPVAGHR